jgi:hypothetical protein
MAFGSRIEPGRYDYEAGVNRSTAIFSGLKLVDSYLVNEAVLSSEVIKL